MADYPGLPNWGYGARLDVGLSDLLSLLPARRRREREEHEARLGKTEAETKELEARPGLLKAQTKEIIDMLGPRMDALLAQANQGNAQAIETLRMLTPRIQALEEQTGLLGAQKAETSTRTGRIVPESEARVRNVEAQTGTLDALRDVQQLSGLAEAIGALGAPELERLKLAASMYGPEYAQIMGPEGKPVPNPAREVLQRQIYKGLGARLPSGADEGGPTEADRAAFDERRGARARKPLATGGSLASSALGMTQPAWLGRLLGPLFGGAQAQGPQAQPPMTGTQQPQRPQQPQPSPWTVPPALEQPDLSNVPSLTELMKRIFMTTNFPPELTEPSGKAYYRNRKQGGQ